MTNILMVLKPRSIRACVNSIRSLKVDKVWFEGFREPELEVIIQRFIQSTSYDNYLITSDDVVVNAKSLYSVQELLTRHYAATAYCNCWENSDVMNVCKTPLTRNNGIWGNWDDYDFFRKKEIAEGPEVFKSWFGGWTLTGMKREIWLKYPFRVNQTTYMQSDYECAVRMSQDGLYFLCHKDSETLHLKKAPGMYNFGSKNNFTEKQIKLDFKSPLLLL